MKVVKKALSTIFTLFFILIFTFSVYTNISAKISGKEPQIFGYQLKSVLSGSMEPSIKTGSVIAIKPAEDPSSYKKGDVITYRALDNANMLITHRVIDVQTLDSQIHYFTKGDNNDGQDSNPIPASHVVGQYEGFMIPYIGYGLNFYNTDAGKILLLIIPGFLLLGYAIWKTWKMISSIKDEEETKELDSPKSV
jgi:signal peptidase I